MSSDEECKEDNQIKSINDYFPNEVLEDILRNLSQTGLCQARLVCQRWRLLVDEVIGHNVAVTSFSTLAHFLPRDEAHKYEQQPIDFCKIKSLNLHGLAIRHLTVGSSEMMTNDNVPIFLHDMKNSLEPLPTLMFPHILESLSCFEPLSPAFLSALPELIKLNYLNISLFSLASLCPQKSFRSPQTLYSLKTLVISKTPTYPEFNSYAAISQLNKFLELMETPKLTSFQICYPVQSLLAIEDDSTRHIMQFLEKCSKTLQSLSIYAFSPTQSFLPPSKEYEYSVGLLDEMKALGKTIQLKTIELKDNHLHSLRPSLQVKAWANFVKQQGSLESLKLLLKSSLELEDLMDIIQKNSTRLRCLEVSFFPCEVCKDSKDIYFIPVDCTRLNYCTALEKLISSDKLKNTEYLPQFLKYIYVDAMLSNKDAHNLLCFGKGQLERIELKDTRGGTPKKFGFGVEIRSLMEVVTCRKIKRLILYSGCTDGKFPFDGIPNGDIGDPRILRKRRSERKGRDSNTTSPKLISFTEYEHLQLEGVRVDWKLNSRGFYENNEAVYYGFEVEDKEHIKESVDNSQSAPLTNSSQNGEIKHQLFKCVNLFSTYQ